MMLRDKKTLFIFFLILLFVSACATTPRTGGGVYHNVKKGETLWRIARTYDCDPDEIARANNLTDTTIEAGSALFIPNATETLDIVIDTTEIQNTATATATATATKEVPHKIREEDLGPGPTDKPAPATVISEKKVPATPPQQSYRPRFIWPTEGTVTSKFGTYKGMRHNGIKIDGVEGAPVLAAAGGTVTYAAPMKYFGETIIIKHSDTYSTVYSQLKKLMAKVGATVGQGDQIGLLGKGETGKPRLYFEIRRENRAKDPLRYLPKKK